MIIFFIDFGLLFLLLFIFVGPIIGGFVDVLTYVLAHLPQCLIVFATIGFIEGLVVSILRKNKYSWLAGILTTPAVYMYPLIVVIPWFVKQFHKSVIGTLILSPIAIIVMFTVFIILWFLHVFIVLFPMTEEDDEEDKLPQWLTLVGAIITSAIQTGLVILLYNHWIVN